MLEVLVGLDEDLLGDILRLGVIARQTGSGRKNHVLIGTHERRELDRTARLRGWRLHWCRFV